VSARAAPRNRFRTAARGVRKAERTSSPGPAALAVSDRECERRKFYVTNTGMTSTLLRPNLAFAAYFNNLAELMQVVAIPEIDTVRLDDVTEIRDQGCDLLKLDTQGSEAEILTHASKTL
jgi:FkbM family methyltransferase